MKKIITLIMSIIMTMGALSLIACGTKSASFTVKFDGNGGTQISGDSVSLEQTVEKAQDIVEPVFEKDGYIFDGWSIAIGSIKEDTTVVAQWKEDASFVVTFNMDGGEQNSYDKTTLIQKVNNASEIREPLLEKEGYKFDGWDKEISTITEDATITAKWKARRYYISFNKNGGVWDEGYSDNYRIEVNYGQAVTDLPTLTKSGYKFEKWVITDTNEEINGKDFSPSVEYNYVKNIRLRASWVDADSYVITYENTEISGLKTNFYETEQSFKLGQPTKEGYEFLGWTGEGITTPTKDVTIIPSEVTTDLTYKANWAKKTFKLVFSTTYLDEKRNVVISYELKNVGTNENANTTVQINYNTIIKSLTNKVEAKIDLTLDSEYQFAYWAYKNKNGEYVNIKNIKATEDIAIDGVITIYPVSINSWIGPY